MIMTIFCGNWKNSAKTMVNLRKLQPPTFFQLLIIFEATSGFKVECNFTKFNMKL